MKEIKQKNFYKKVNTLIKNIGKDRISEYSAQCSYYTILSFIPFVILFITLIQYTKIEPQTLFNVISKIIPENMNDIIMGIIQEVYSKSIGTISISIIFVIWSAGKGFFALTKGLQTIYHTPEKKQETYITLRIKVFFKTIIFIVLIVIGLVILVFGNTLRDFLYERYGMFKNYNIFSNISTKLLIILITILVFLLLYKFIPKHKVPFKSQIIGAALGGIALNIISFVFSKFLYIFKGFSITYGSLTTLMLIMMWTYSCFYVVFLGAELNKLIKINQENID